jgi:hypothetical protein
MEQVIITIMWFVPLIHVCFCVGTIASLTCVPHAAGVGRMLREMLDQRCARSSFNVVTSV